MERAYVDPCRISIRDRGIITYETSTKTIALPELYSSSEGCFVKCNENDLETLSHSDDVRFWWCATRKTFGNVDK